MIGDITGISALIGGEPKKGELAWCSLRKDTNTIFLYCCTSVAALVYCPTYEYMWIFARSS